MAISDNVAQVAQGMGIAQASGAGATAIVNTTDEELLRRLIVDALVDVQRQESAAYVKIETLSKQIGVTQEAVIGFFRILDEQEVPLEQLADKLTEIAKWHKELLDRLAVLDTYDLAVKDLIEQARLAIEISHYDKADRLLSEAEETDIAAARQLQEIANQRLLNAAATRAERGQISLTSLNYLDAAQHFRFAADLVPQESAIFRKNYLDRYANALYLHGYEKGDNTVLLQTIDVYRMLLNDKDRDHMPSLDWAEIQNNLGNALWKLGEHENGAERLEEAVAAYRAALEERIRERVPLEWAMTQNNLGNALARLGERKNNTSLLEEAVAAYRAALEEQTRELMPLEWAMTQNNLGNALWKLGEHENGTEHLEKAVVAYRTALEEQTRELMPLEWAMTQNNLGNALARLSERKNNTSLLEEAVAAYHTALEERTQDRIPLGWAMTQNNLGNALAMLGERKNDTQRLEEAIIAYHAALEERTRERVPLQWSKTRANLGNTLAMLGICTGYSEHLKMAKEVIEEVYDFYKGTGDQQINDELEEQLKILSKMI